MALVYADDIILLSWTARGLQNLLDRLGTFCTNHKLTINAAKSEILVCGVPTAGQWMVGEVTKVPASPQRGT